MIKESDIIAESGLYWVLKCNTGFDVMKNQGTHSKTVASFGHNQLDIAQTYFKYLSTRGQK
jgi:hypothetical protein